ncbi:MAG: sulfite exporter TauE/SafE family protein [Hydrogenothermaceae bacterium]|nr:sulfite exporter TauE/SafE family protein [Hydrogenothermaceae bacterium]
MEILLPIANISVNPFEIVIIGFWVGILSGMLGIGGGIVVNPILIKLGVPSVVVVGTSISQMIGASLSGFLTYLRSKLVDIKMGLFIVGFGTIGGITGIFIINYFKHLGNVRQFVLSVYVVYLLLLGIFILLETIKNKGKEDKKGKIKKFCERLPLKTEFKVGERSIIIPAFIGILSGLLSAIMGIGGGNLVIPALMYLAGYSIQMAVAVSVFQMIFIASFLAFLHSLFNHGVDIVLGILLLIGSSFGAVFGALLGQKMKRDYLKLILVFLMITVAIYSLFQLLERKREVYNPILPDNILSHLLVEYPYIYSSLVVILSLVMGFIISSFAFRLRTFLLAVFSKGD